MKLKIMNQNYGMANKWSSLIILK